MKKWVRKAISVALSGALLLGASGMAGATTQLITNAADATTFTLPKTYVDASGNSATAPAEKLTYTITPYGVWNAEGKYPNSGVFSTIPNNFPMPDGSSTPAAYNSSTNTSNTVILDDTSSSLNATVYLPDYPTVGDYWYKIEEKLGNTDTSGSTITYTPTVGVIYGTNDEVTGNITAENGSHNRLYYLHVQVVNVSGIKKYVTIHKTAPTGGNDASYNANYGSDDAVNGKYVDSNKVSGIQNTFYTGQLTVTKALNGNAADKTQFFKVKVTFTKPSGTTVGSTITASAIDARTVTNATAAATANPSSINIDASEWSTDTVAREFWLQGDSASSFNTVTFTGIPYGINYTVDEYEISDSGYTNKFAVDSDSSTELAGFNGLSTAANGGLTADEGTAASPEYDSRFISSSSDTNVGAKGSITDAADAVTITNNKTVVIDIGVITEDAPYMTLMAVCAAAAVLMVARKKRIFED